MRFPAIIKATPFVVGVLLMVAATLKAQQLFTDPPASADLQSSLWFRLLLIEVEAVTGLAMLLGFCLPFFRRAAQLLFAAFAAFSFYQLAFGAKSCGCMGSLEVAPAAMMIVDLVLFVALVVWRPAAQAPRRVAMAWPVALICLLALLPPFALLAAAPAGPDVEVTPAVLGLGVLKPGDRRECAFQVRNPGNGVLEIDGIESSCPCLAVKTKSFVLGPQSQFVLAAEFDAVRKPDFRGAVLIQITGQTSAGRTVLLGQIDVEVRE